jgi:hypothetical protein
MLNSLVYDSPHFRLTIVRECLEEEIDALHKEAIHLQHNNMEKDLTALDDRTAALM